MLIRWLQRFLGRSIEAVIFERDGRLVAVCLRPYLVTQADNWEHLLERLREIIGAHIAISVEKGQSPFRELKSAPRRYWQMYESATFAQRMPVALDPPDELRSPVPALRLRALPLAGGV